MGLGSGIRKKPILDPGSRGQKGTGSRIRIRNTAFLYFCGSFLPFWNADLEPANQTKADPCDPDPQKIKIKIKIYALLVQFCNTEFTVMSQQPIRKSNVCQLT
jgi:hypothetical protein